MSDEQVLYLHCSECLLNGKPGNPAEALVRPGRIEIICECGKLIAGFAHDTSAILGKGCGIPHPEP